MCIILVGMITRRQHQLALQANGDGFSLYTEKLGLIKKPSKAEVAQAIGDFGIWHYRIATSGEVGVSNIHPFEVSGGDYLLYHNGVLGEGLGKMSDTRALANTLYFAPVETVRTVLTALADNNRFLLVDAKDPYCFELFGKWVAEAGVIMSRKLYSGYVSSRQPYSYPMSYATGPVKETRGYKRIWR